MPFATLWICGGQSVKVSQEACRALYCAGTFWLAHGQHWSRLTVRPQEEAGSRGRKARRRHVEREPAQPGDICDN